MWRLKACTHCLGGDHHSYDAQTWCCFQCGFEVEATNGRAPRPWKPKAPTWSDKVAEAMAGFLEMVGVEGGA